MYIRYITEEDKAGGVEFVVLETQRFVLESQ